MGGSSVLFITLCVVLSFSAIAKAFPIPDTGQTQSYTDTFGEDHDYIINAHSYTDLGNDIVRDNVTGLEWQKENAPSTYTWEQALSYCENLSLGGHSDWRLPTIKELSTLVDSSIPYPGPTIDTNYFPDTATDYPADYWSSTNVSYNNLEAWFVDFANGYVLFKGKGHLQNNTYAYVRAVRGLSADNIFADNGDGTISDIQTGLMWQQTAPSSVYSWDQALTYCENLNLGGYTDWRLPNRNELQSIVDYSKYFPAITSTFFIETFSDTLYWTSTTHANSPNLVWVLGSVTGHFGSSDKNSYYSLRAVRSIKIPFNENEYTPSSSEQLTPFGTLNSLGEFKPELDTYIISHGWNRENTIEIPSWESAIGEKIMDETKNNANVFLWNWQEKAQGDAVSVKTRVPDSGKYLANAMDQIIQSDYNKNIYMIGHSYGSGVIVNAAKNLIKLKPDLKDNIKQLTILDPPDYLFDPIDEKFLKENKDAFFVDNYSSSLLSLGRDIADINIYLDRSGESRNCYSSDEEKNSWYAKTNAHSYAYVWYYSSIDNFANKNILCDEKTPESQARGGFNFINNHENLSEEYVQHLDLPRWQIIPYDVLFMDSESECIDEGQYLCDEEPTDAEDLDEYAYNNKLKISINKAYTFRTINESPVFYTNKLGNAVYDSQKQKITLITHSDAIAYSAESFHVLRPKVSTCSSPKFPLNPV